MATPCPASMVVELGRLFAVAEKQHVRRTWLPPSPSPYLEVTQREQRRQRVRAGRARIACGQRVAEPTRKCDV
jgi:hypothetical protein